MNAFQVAVADAVRDANEDIRLRLDQALAILEDAAVPAEDHPRGFAFGDGGRTDALRDGVRAALEDLHADVEARLRKTDKALRKVGWALSSRLSAPAPFVERTGIGPHADAFPLTLDIAVAARDLAVDDSVVLRVGGACAVADGPVNLLYTHAAGGAAVNALSPSADGRWSTSVTGLAAGNYALEVTFSGFLSGGAYAAIGTP